jgi:hypothetical protein
MRLVWEEDRVSGNKLSIVPHGISCEQAEQRRQDFSASRPSGRRGRRGGLRPEKTGRVQRTGLAGTSRERERMIRQRRWMQI